MALKGAAEWTPIYMLIVMIIAAILIYTLIKPIMQGASQVASSNLEESNAVIKNAITIIRNNV
jgi:hypothetical protein